MCSTFFSLLCGIRKWSCKPTGTGDVGHVWEFKQGETRNRWNGSWNVLTRKILRLISPITNFGLCEHCIFHSIHTPASIQITMFNCKRSLGSLRLCGLLPLSLAFSRLFSVSLASSLSHTKTVSAEFTLHSCSTLTDWQNRQHTVDIAGRRTTSRREREWKRYRGKTVPVQTKGNLKYTTAHNK